MHEVGQVFWHGISTSSLCRVDLRIVEGFLGNVHGCVGFLQIVQYAASQQ